MPIHGLTAAEVESRRAAGLTNCPPRSPTKTTGEIVRDNICTYFNLVFLVLALMLLSVGSWLNMGFLGIVFWNTLIGIIQQLRAKKTIDDMAIGALQAIQSAGRTVNKDIYLVGVDALDAAKNEVANGNMTGTVLNDAKGQATPAVECMEELLGGKTYAAGEQSVYVDYVKVTPDNVKDFQ